MSRTVAVFVSPLQPVHATRCCCSETRADEALFNVIAALGMLVTENNRHIISNIRYLLLRTVCVT
jgi:hypothetical protein